MTGSPNERTDGWAKSHSIGRVEVGRGSPRSSVREETRWQMREVRRVSSVLGSGHSMTAVAARSVPTQRQPGRQEWEERRPGPGGHCAPAGGRLPRASAPSPHTLHPAPDTKPPAPTLLETPSTFTRHSASPYVEHDRAAEQAFLCSAKDTKDSRCR